MLVRTKAKYLPQPSAAVKERQEIFKKNTTNPVEYVKDRYNHFTTDEKLTIKKFLGNVTTKIRAKFRKELKAKFPASQTQYLDILLIELIHSHKRLPVIKIITDILRALCGREVNKIKIAILREKGKPARYICYDGQHTLIVLYLLGYKIVPIDVCCVKTLAEVREQFRLANGKGIHGKISSLEDFRQEVLRYVEDGIRDIAAILANQIQQLLVLNCMAMDGQGRILNTISRVHELYELKDKKLQQMYIDCYKHRIARGIDTVKYPGMGSKESRFYYVMIMAGYTVKQINKITDYLYDVEGTSTAFADSDFWNNVDNHTAKKEGETALRFLLYEYENYSDLEDFGVIL